MLSGTVPSERMRDGGGRGGVQRGRRRASTPSCRWRGADAGAPRASRRERRAAARRPNREASEEDSDDSVSPRRPRRVRHEGGHDGQRNRVAAGVACLSSGATSAARADAGLQPGSGRVGLRLRQSESDRRRSARAATPGTSGPAATRSSGCGWRSSPRATSTCSRTWTRGCTAAGSRRSARSRSRDVAPRRRPTSTGCGWISASSRPCPASRATRRASSGCGDSPIRSSTRPTGTPRRTSSTRARCSRPTSSGWRAGSATSASIRSTRRRIPKRPKWANLAGAIGNQYWEEGRLFNLRMPPTDFRWHVGNRQPPGTSDTSRFATDHINNPNAINSVFNLAYRPTAPETMADGTTRQVHHILKDGADSVGVAGASLRVYVNIGMCSDYWLTLHDPVIGRKPQQPFVMDHARKNCEDWRNTEARMENAEAFLKTLGSDAPERCAGRRGVPDRATPTTLRRGKMAFADKCARCHSSKQPPREIATDRRQGRGVVSRVGAEPGFPRQELPLRRSPLSRLSTRHQHRARGRDQRDGGAGLGGVLVGDLQAAAGDRQNQRALQPARSRQAARVGAEGRRPRLLPDADAHLDVGDGAVSPQQRARDVREGPVGARPDARRSTTRPRSCCGPNDGSACSRSS